MEFFISSNKTQFLIETSNIRLAIKITLDVVEEEPCVVDSVAGCGEVALGVVVVRLAACVGVSWALVCDTVVVGVCDTVLEDVEETCVVLVDAVLKTEGLVVWLVVIGVWLVVETVDVEGIPVDVVVSWLEEAVVEVGNSVVWLIVVNNSVVVSCCPVVAADVVVVISRSVVVTSTVLRIEVVSAFVTVVVSSFSLSTNFSTISKISMFFGSDLSFKLISIVSFTIALSSSITPFSGSFK